MRLGVGVVLIFLGGGSLFLSLSHQAQGTSIPYFLGSLIIPAVLTFAGIYVLRKTPRSASSCINKKLIRIISALFVALILICIFWPQQKTPQSKNEALEKLKNMAQQAEQEKRARDLINDVSK